MRTRTMAIGCCMAALAVAGCGGDDSGADASSGSGGESSEEAAAQPAPALDAVLACMQEQGLDAEEQSSNVGGESIGVDFSGGRLLVSFEESAEDAELTASVAQSNQETAVVKGSVVITIPDDPGAQAAQAATEGCVDSP